MGSIWRETIDLPHFTSLEGDAKTEVLIIGGGMTGILCAYFLQQQGVDYILAEGKTICSGGTGNTTAKITAQHGLLYGKLLKSRGAESAGQYLEANQSAVECYAGICKKVHCDFERKPAFVYALDDRRKLEQEARALEQLGQAVDLRETCELPFPVAGALCFENQAQFHPLKFVAAVSAGLHIYEHTFVKELTEHFAVTEKGRIIFEKVIFATHFPIDNRHGLYFLKLYQHRSYVIALENAPQLSGMYVDEAACGMSFRNYKEYLLIGGGDHRTGKQGGGWQELRSFANRFYPGAEEKYSWAAQDCMALDGIPYIGKYSKHRPWYLTATGFQKWGMTSAMAAAQILTDMILEKENPYEKVFNPSRNMIKPQLLVNGGEALAGLLTPAKKRCPHMGCALKWNDAEQSWDCSCHGSRFDREGRVLDNPANGNLKIKE